MNQQTPKTGARPFIPGVPESHEFSPWFAGYVDKARSFADPVQKLAEQMAEALSLFGSLPPDKHLHRYAPGKWSVQEVLGHLIDAERIFAYRTLRIARNDQTPLAGFDENQYVIASETEHCDWKELLEEWEHVRRASILLLAHLPEGAWTRMGTSNGEPISVRALAYIMVGHVAHHLLILRERY